MTGTAGYGKTYTAIRFDPQPQMVERRLVNPRAEIRAAAGREGHLRSLGALALWPANSLFVEGYLTTQGDALAPTLRMIRDAGFEVEGNPAGTREASLPASGFRLEGSEGEILKPEVASSARAAAGRPGRSSAARTEPRARPGKASAGLSRPSAHKP